MSNMYPQSVKQWNPFVGCRFNCVYCKNSFQRQLKRWGKNNCQPCYDYIPHEHPKRLEFKLPKTRPGQFVFVCAPGDISFCENNYLHEILKAVIDNPNTDFLFQSKNPEWFLIREWPENVILATTFETNRFAPYEGITNAPHPTERLYWLKQSPHKRKAVTMEPIIDFDIYYTATELIELRPEWVAIGYDTRKNDLIEPEPWKVLDLIEILRGVKITVHEKLIREPNK